ncbi:MAG: hypothetical protein WCT14_15750 [Treponemataceae bacterium]
MMRPRFIQAAFVAATLLRAFSAFAEDPVTTSSSVPEVRLPDMEEEARSVAPRDVEAPLPPLKALPLPVSEPPLPAERELSIPESAYRTQATLDTSARTALGETFTEASVGAGLWDAISANLSIYRPDADPSFSMTFAHDSKDGFAFHEAGQGFYERRTALSGRVRGMFDQVNTWGFSAGFSDEAVGLQGKSTDFYGITHRYFDVRGDYKRILGSVLGGSLDASAVVKAYSASRAFELANSSPTGVLGVDELSASPNVGIALRYQKLALLLNGEYDFRGLFGLADGVPPLDRLSHRGRADLSAQWDVSSSLDLKAAVGFASSSSFPVLVPFSLSADAGLGGFASLSLDGGLRTETTRFSVLWRDNPYLDIGSLPPDDARWYVGSKIDFFLVPGLTAVVGVDWAKSFSGGGRVVPVYNYNGGRALYNYSIAEYNTFQSKIGLRWLKGPVSFSMRWESDWMDAPVVGETQRLKVELEYRERNESFGGAFSGSLGFAGTQLSVPILDASGFVRLSPEIRLIAEFNDAAAAFLGKEGRTRWSPYLTSGFQASARILISL